MEKKYVTTIILEHLIEDDTKHEIFKDLMKRIAPKGPVDITIDSMTVQEAPQNAQPEYYRQLLDLAKQYQQEQALAQQEGYYPQEQQTEVPPQEPQPQSQPQEQIPEVTEKE